MLKKYFLVFLISATLLFAVNKEEIEPYMVKQVNEVLSILKNDQIKKEDKNEKIVSIMDPIFDYTLMARLSLGKEWNTLSSGKKEEFTTLFTKVLKNSYLHKLDLYTNQKIKFLGIEEPKKNRVVLNTVLIGEKENFDINYKFYQKEENEWKIYDINLLGVSIIQTYRQQFAGFLKDKSLDELFKNLNSKK
ncbi:toluene tolerance protein [Arcobacter sp. CECT 8983]|uniref:MlaC/ttg2D family ABC transporter substrate-binding protein n=1 Tax=Arcobacter sp. CECT 8983 TaxID=2044508 RepID=UPI00100AB704|nr:ABC transporter substrate-binding protein [Arcobacter sp. CECT 8983]RXJ88857.1 toluene tolerance protein [Arcobacter sp. CECT 8983]